MSAIQSYFKVAEGTVSVRQPNTALAVALGPRCAVTREGEVVCTFNAQSALGVNDFTPMLSRSSDHGITWNGERLIWPHLQQQYSIFGSVSGSPQGDLFFFGARTKIEKSGEPN